MSGIFGLFNQNGAPVTRSEMDRMASCLERRGPDGTAHWHEGATGLGLTLLATTPELVFERQPLRHAPTGCVIAADVRLDNRDELLAALGLTDRAAVVGDAGLILEAYLAWGESCVERLLGDFAFAIWDPRRRALFCARDPFGMRPLYYHHTPGRFLAFASEPRGILVLPQAPYRINEGRIADFLVPQLEGIDKTSSFFEEVYRLPPAHALTVTPSGVAQRRYWTLEPRAELRLSSNDAYAEAFLEVFTEAVRCRLRSAGPIGAMLSGGMDSGSVVAVARDLLAQQGRGPLPTFSAVGPDTEACVETRSIHAALTMDGLDPHLIRHDRLDEFMPMLEELAWGLDEPFDNHMTLVRAVYLAAHRRGLRSVLDGVAGDVVLGEGNQIARLLRRGRWLSAYREARGRERFWRGAYPAWRELLLAGRSAVATPALRSVYRHVFGPRRHRKALDRIIRESGINPDFAQRIRLGERLQVLDGQAVPGLSISHQAERAQSIDGAYLTVARERYDRAASAVALEPRDPFLDRRVVALCLALPAEQKLGDGWPKIVLRRAMAGRLPDAVCWRRGKEHLGWAFTRALILKAQESIASAMDGQRGLIAPYLKVAYCSKVGSRRGETDASDRIREAYAVYPLAAWLHLHQRRPQAKVDWQRSF